MLGRLRITQRLSLLLLLPLVAVVLISVPFTVERVDDARAAGAVVDGARNARAIGSVVQELQQERLLALAYLASPRLNRSVLVAQIQSSVDVVEQSRAALTGPARPALTASLDELDRIGDVRQRVLGRATTMAEVHGSYHDAVRVLLDGLRLADNPGTDATGLRQMGALDALLRRNEQANQLGAALVMAAQEPDVASGLASRAGPLEQVYLDKFRQDGEPAHVELLTVEATGPTATSVNELVGRLTGSAQPKQIPIDVGLSAAQTGVAVRRGLQDRIASDIASGASARAAAAETAAVVVGLFASALLVLVIGLGIAVSRSVARPLRRITVAATVVADLASREMVRVTDVESDDEGAPRLAALTLRSADEIGELASAFNRVQATAALLMERQVTTRRNVAVMFGNIAHRTQSLVSRQLAQIDELERNERDEQRLANLYRLDHLTSRLRRSADSLLVIAGTRDEARLAVPTALSDVIRSAVAEVEGYQNVRLAAIGDVTIVAAAVADLTLLLAELLENATAFSPPDVPVEVTATSVRGCLVRVVDRGIGMSPERLAEENERLISRERLDVAPTTMLGLFVVGRLARRHGIEVRLLQTPISGVTVEVELPAELLLWGGAPGLAQPDRVGRGRAAAISPAPPAAIGPPQRSLGGSAAPPAHPWSQQFQPSAPEPVPALRVNGSHGATDASHPAIDARHAAIDGSSRGGLRRRERGASLPDLHERSEPASQGPTMRDPEAERADIDAFAQGSARASNWSPAAAPGASSQPGASSRPGDSGTFGRPPQPRSGGGAAVGGGLQRRRPGEHLAEEIRAEMDRPGYRSPTKAAQHGPPAAAAAARDAEAERAALNSFLDGLSRAAHNSHPPRDPWSPR